MCCQIPGAEALVIRVVSSVDKKLEVKPRFLEIFQEENYPTEFPYKSKVMRKLIYQSDRNRIINHEYYLMPLAFYSR